jgi:hypothetical protein
LLILKTEFYWEIPELALCAMVSRKVFPQQYKEISK